MMTANSIDDDNLLLAVRYVLNECDRNELAAFESRLADDSAAQQALVEAVQIVALLQATPICEPASRLQAARAVPLRRSWQVASLLVAGLLVAVVMFWPAFPAPSGHRTAEVPTVPLHTESPALAQAWTALDPHLITPDETDEAHSADDDNTEPAYDVPDWLLTAVLVEEEQGGSDENDMGIEEETQL